MVASASRLTADVAANSEPRTRTCSLFLRTGTAYGRQADTTNDTECKPFLLIGALTMRISSLVTLAALSLSACSGGSEAAGPITPPPVLPPRLASLTLASDTARVFVGDSVKIVVTGKMSDGTTASALGLTATSGLGVRLNILGDTAYVVGVRIANTWFSVTSNLRSVQGNPISAEGVAIARQPALRVGVSPGSLCSKPGTVDYQYRMLGIDSTGAPVDVGPAAWSVADTSIATITTDGRLTTRASAGSTHVIGKAMGLTAYGIVTIDSTLSCSAP